MVSSISPGASRAISTPSVCITRCRAKLARTRVSKFGSLGSNGIGITNDRPALYPNLVAEIDVAGGLAAAEADILRRHLDEGYLDVRRRHGERSEVPHDRPEERALGRARSADEHRDLDPGEPLAHRRRDHEILRRMLDEAQDLVLQRRAQRLDHRRVDGIEELRFPPPKP